MLSKIDKNFTTFASPPPPVLFLNYKSGIVNALIVWPGGSGGASPTLAVSGFHLQFLNLSRLAWLLTLCHWDSPHASPTQQSEGNRMTAAQTIQLKLSSCRQRLNELLQVETRSAEEQTEMETLTAEVSKREPELRAALASEPDTEEVVTANVDSETRERLELRGKAQVGAFVSAALNSQAVTGAEAEYAAAVNCAPLGMIPISIFDRDRPEVRAVTPGVDAQTTANPTSPFVFERSIAASVLGIQFPVVPPGVANYPVISTAPPSGAVAKDTAAVATAAAVRLDTRSPKRVAGQFQIRIEDLATMPSLENDLRQSLMMSASNAIDEQVIAGNGTAPNLTGLFKLAADVAIAGAKETFATGVARFAALVDGQFSNSLSDLRAIIGSSTFALYSGLFAGNGSTSLSDYLSQRLGGFAVSNRVPIVASSGQKGLVVLTGGDGPMRVPVWSNMELIVDPYTNAGKGQRTVTVTTLVSDPHLPYGVSTVKEVHAKLS